MTSRLLLLLVAIPWMVAGQARDDSRNVLPPPAAAKLASSLKASAPHTSHVWRDTLPFNGDGSVNAYIEIARGDRRKWEFDMRANARAIDRVIPADPGGYPVNYGFVPQTVFYDGDPFDVLVLGPPLRGGSVVRGVIVGLMFMDDWNGPDSKVVFSRTGRNGQPLHELTPAIQQEIGGYFNRYRAHEPDKFAKVPGWGSVAEGLAHIETTHAFFRECRQPAVEPCRIAR